MSATPKAPKPFFPDVPARSPAGKIRVMVATPKRSYNGIEDLPAAIGHALRELVLRGVPRSKVEHDPKLYAEWIKFQTENEVADAAFRAQADQYEFEFAAAVGGMCRARNNCVAEMLKEPIHFIIWNDDDLVRADGYHGLAEVWLRLLSHRMPIVGAIYCTRKKRPTWAATWMPSAEYQPDRNGALQVAELAGGLKCIHRKVFTEVARIFGPDEREQSKASIRYRDRDSGETMFGFYQNVVMDRDLMSEDYYLDYLARCIQIPIFADTGIKVRHVGADGAVYPEGDWPPIPALEKDFTVESGDAKVERPS